VAWREFCTQGAGALTPGGFVPWPGETFLADLPDFLAWLPADALALYVPGALADTLLQTVLDARRSLDFLVPAGTHVLASRELMDRLLARGQKLYALTPLRAVAITVNPFSPDGARIEPGALLAAFEDAFPGLPVVDVLLGRDSSAAPTV
jgi:hypothetical protein